MRTTKNPAVTREALQQAIDNLVEASVDNSWKGGQDAASIPEIEMRLEVARLRLRATLDDLFAKGGER